MTLKEFLKIPTPSDSFIQIADIKTVPSDILFDGKFGKLEKQN